MTDGYEHLASRFRPVFARIAGSEIERERSGDRADAQLAWLFDAGFGWLRVPAELGGIGARLSDVLRLTAELAEADANLAHVWRNHFSFVEDRLHSHRDDSTIAWLRRLAGGELVGGGWSERGVQAVDEASTRIVRAPDGWRVTGTKYYSTGSIYATWTTVRAHTERSEDVVALVDMHQPGVTVDDDWDGFGQRLTGSGGVRYDNAHVDDDKVFSYEERYTYQTQYYQSMLNALLVGIGRAALRDGIAALRSRRRAHPANVSSVAREDPQLLQVVGEVAALVAAADGAFLRSLPAIDEVVDDAAVDGTRSWIGVAEAQLVITQSVLAATTAVFDALGASGVSGGIALDRHWRNARTLASHNPRVARARIVGDWLVNGTPPGTARYGAPGAESGISARAEATP